VTSIINSRFPSTLSTAAIKPFAFGDAFIVALLIVAAFYFFTFVNKGRSGDVAIIRDNITIATYPLAPDRRFFITGKIGPMELEIKNKSVKVLSSTCPKQICLDAAPIRLSGQQIICSPNHILIEIVSSQRNGPDAVTR
jgi:hypothetical protein